MSNPGKDVSVKDNTITIKKYIRAKALGLLGLIDSDINPTVREDRLTYVNNIDDIQKIKLDEYNVWYTGDSDELINFYTRANSIDYNTDPLYNRNKKSYFWCVSSTESDIKRTHSGQPRNIVDTLVNIIGIPAVDSGNEVIRAKIRNILAANNFNKILGQKARPLTFVEGWGGWKINWDKSVSKYPILLYYRADAVDFIFRNNMLAAIIYKDYYQDENGDNYILFEIRRLDGQDLIIEKELFKMMADSEILMPCKLTDVPQLKDTKEKIKISNLGKFLGGPNIYFYDSSEDCYGRSIFTGKIDLFDDLDQCLSQAANAVRRSTPTEVWDTNFLERDARTGMPIMPHSFDRKYVAFRGLRGGDGLVNSTPVNVTQPAIDFAQYSAEEINLLLQIVAGIMSPATLGIDIAKKDNAEAQREKEKVTIFTRNTVIAEEMKIIKDLCNELLIADELMRTRKFTCDEYDIDVQYDELADSSWESKLETVLMGWQAGLLSDDIAIDLLYRNSLGKASKDREIKFIKDQRAKTEQMATGGTGEMPMDEDMLGDLGAELGGNANNENNFEKAKGKAKIDAGLDALV